MIGIKATPELYAIVLEALADIPPEVTEVSIRASEMLPLGLEVVARVDQQAVLRCISNRLVTDGRDPAAFVQYELDQIWADLKTRAGLHRPAPGPGAAWGSRSTTLPG